MPKARVLPNPPHERHLLPIPLPHGRSGTTGSLTVFFAPRLRHQGPLWDYQEWVDWPDTRQQPHVDRGLRRTGCPARSRR